MKFTMGSYPAKPYIISGLILLTWLLYRQTTGFDFVWDDTPIHIGNNPYLNPPAFDNIKQVWTDFYWRLYIPVTYTAWGILKFINPYIFPGQNEPFIFHFANVLVHTCNGLLVFVLLLKMRFSRLSSAAGAVLFLVHPLQVESVAWVSEFRGLLAGLFGFLAIYVNLLNRGAKKGYDRPIRFHATILFSSLLFLCAMLSKPSAISFLLFAMAIEYFVFSTSPKGIALRLWPWCLLAGGMAILISTAHDTVTQYPIWVKPLLWMDAVSFYLAKLLFPIPLVACYARTVEYLTAQWWFYIVWLVPVAGGYLCCRKIPSKRLYAALSIFIAGFLPVSGLKAFAFQEWSMVADRYLYLSMFGVSAALALLLDRYKSRWVLTGTTAALCLFAGLSFVVQIPTWQNDLTLWGHCVKENPKAAKAWNGRGNAYLGRQNYDRALEDFNKAIALEPDYVDALNNRGTLYGKTGDYDKAIKDLNTALSFDLHNKNALKNRGSAYFEKRNYPKAIEDFSAYLKLNPGHEETYLFRGVALARTGKIEAAISDFTTLLAVNPNHPKAYHQRAGTYIVTDRYDKAIADLNVAIKLEPDYAAAYERRGLAYQNTQAIDLALEDFETAISLNPKSPDAYFYRGNIFVKQQQYEKAIKDYTKAVEISLKHSGAYNNRGLAYFYLAEYQKSWADMQKAMGYGHKVDQNFIRLLKDKLGK